MRAIVYTKYGPPEVLQRGEVEKPAPRDNEVLIRVRATSVNFGDILARKFNTVTPRTFSMPWPLWLPVRLMFGLSKPRKQILGSEFAGDIEAAGKGVRLFKEGDQVFGYRSMRLGANAEYVTMPENGMVAAKPANISYEQAATVPGGAITALNILKKVDIRSGHKVLVNGASGGIGSHALQLARHFGAEVTGVAGANRLDMMRAMGADHVVDYTQEDFTQSGETYDLILDVLGKSSFSRCKYSLKENGRYLLASFGMTQLFQMLWTSIKGGKRVICAMSSENPRDLVFIRQLVEAGEIKSVIDRSFPLEQAAEAHRYIEEGHKKGHVVLTLVPDDNT